MAARQPSGPYLLFTLAVSLFALAMLAVDTLFQLDPRTHEIIAWLDNAVCLLFFLDFVVTFWRAERKAEYFFRWGWLDLLSSIPMVDELRWGRLARIFRIFRILRGLRSAKLLSELVVLRRHESALLSAALISLLLLVFSSITILQLETDPASNIRDADDALWWSITTLTTVGYGDLYPVTGPGRLLAAAMMVAGVGLFGALSGLVASLLLRPAESRQQADLETLQAEILSLRRQLAEQAPDAQRKARDD